MNSSIPNKVIDNNKKKFMTMDKNNREGSPYIHVYKTKATNSGKTTTIKKEAYVV